MSSNNDSGWYRVNQEKERLEREVERLREALGKIEQNPHRAVVIAEEALNPPKGPSSTTRPPLDLG